MTSPENSWFLSKQESLILKNLSSLVLNVISIATHCKYCKPASSHGWSSSASPRQFLPCRLGAGLLHRLLLDLRPPEQEPQDDQQLHSPFITPGNAPSVTVHP